MPKEYQIENLRLWLSQGLDLLTIVAANCADSQWEAIYSQCELTALQDQKATLETQRLTLQTQLDALDAQLSTLKP